MKSLISIAVAVVVTTLASGASASSECEARELEVHSVVVEPPLPCAVVTVTEDCGEVVAEVLNECNEPIDAGCADWKVGPGDSLIVTLSTVPQGEGLQEELVLTTAGSTHTVSVTFDIRQMPEEDEGCSYSPGRAGAPSAWGVLLAVAAVVARRVRRRP
jgi:MYXO-CTERM domain-containing protein